MLSKAQGVITEPTPSHWMQKCEQRTCDDAIPQATSVSLNCPVTCQQFTVTSWCRHWRAHCWAGGGSV